MLELRNPTAEELPVIRTLLDRSALFLFDRGIAADADGVYCTELDPASCMLFRDGGENVGVLCMELPAQAEYVPGAPLPKPQERFGTIRWMCVDEAFGRQGLGTALLQIAEGLIMDAGALLTRLAVGRDNAVMAAFLTKNGYAPLEETADKVVWQKLWTSRCPDGR